MILPVIPDLAVHGVFLLLGALLCFPVTPLRRARHHRPAARRGYVAYLVLAAAATVFPFAAGVFVALRELDDWAPGIGDRIGLGLVMGLVSGLPAWLVGVLRLRHEAVARRHGAVRDGGGSAGERARVTPHG
jgi:hypothetical protein